MLVGVVRAITIGFVVGVLGTGAGGVIVALTGSPTKQMISSFLGFSAGVMVSVVAFDLMPEAFSLVGTTIPLVWFVLGTLGVAAIDLVLPHIHHMSTDLESSRYAHTALLVGAGIAMHNVPEGLAVGAGLGPVSDVGWVVAVLIGLHNIPEGIAVGAPLAACNRGRRDIIIAAAVAGLPTVLGTIIGASIGAISPLILASSLAFAAGAMLFVSFDELIPAAQEFARGHTGTFGAVAGIIVAIATSRLLGH